MTLYVNGTASGSSADYSSVESQGSLRIGASEWDGSLGSWLDGSVSGVQVYPTDLSASQVSSLYQDGQNGGTLTTNELTTQWTLDERGLATAEVDPDGYVSGSLYDEAGRLAVSYGNAIDTESDGGTPTASYSVSKTGYDTFGDVAETEDPDGNITTYGYDADGRQTLRTDPSYSQPSTGDVITAAVLPGLQLPRRGDLRHRPRRQHHHLHLRPARRPHVADGGGRRSDQLRLRHQWRPAVRHRPDRVYRAL